MPDGFSGTQITWELKEEQCDGCGRDIVNALVSYNDQPLCVIAVHTNKARMENWLYQNIRALEGLVAIQPQSSHWSDDF